MPSPVLLVSLTFRQKLSNQEYGINSAWIFLLIRSYHVFPWKILTPFRNFDTISLFSIDTTSKVLLVNAVSPNVSLINQLRKITMWPIVHLLLPASVYRVIDMVASTCHHVIFELVALFELLHSSIGLLEMCQIWTARCRRPFLHTASSRQKKKSSL